MGQTLSEPIREKHSESGGDERHAFAASEMQGWRINMEDAHTMISSLNGGDAAFFAVYDGHGGATAAKFAGENVHKRLVSEDTFQAKDFCAALKRAYLGTDEDLRADSNFFRDPSGCTAVSALITKDNKIYVANAGDSRCVLGVKGEAKPLSFDHKPANEGENSRIRAAGGYVEYGRVNGNLALSRAIGDFEFKNNQSLEPEKQIVTCDPEITVHEPTEDDEFIVLACDGIWDCLSSQQVVDITRRLVAEKKELSEICEIIMDKCLAPDSDINGGVGCDNMTVIVVALLRGRTKEQWYDWVADRVECQHGYETPKELPQLYSAQRIAAAKDRWTNPTGQGGRFGGGTFTRPGATGFGALARVFGSNVMFHPSGGLSNNLTFDQDDSSEEYESEDGEHEGANDASRNGALRAPPQRDIYKTLREQLEELQDDDDDADHFAETEDSPRNKKWTIDDDGDSAMTDESSNARSALTKSTIFSRRIGKPSGLDDMLNNDESADTNGVDKLPVGLSNAPPTSIGSPLVPSHSSIQTQAANNRTLQGEAPPPPKVNGVSKSPDTPVEQLKKVPSGDAPSDAVKVDGLLDTSEDPVLNNVAAKSN
ncbi:Protein phosphatase 2C 2 [Tulasnella sp. 403]|nr:Protein phosphatase 2C 2 [Tulasnella sp. 403]